MSPRQMDEYVEAIRAFRPKCIYGYASSVALLAAHAQERSLNMRVPDLRVVCTTGEPLYPHQREMIGRVFGAPVANEFGSRDIGFIAHETPHRQMLLMSESIILEVLREDGSPAASGETGEAVMTGLCSEAQPFIRYRTGDMVKLSTVPCKEGRGLHMIDEVLGRSTDFIVRGDGTIMHALAVIYVLRAVEGVGEFKIVQHAAERIEVLVVPGLAWNEQARTQITQGLQARLGANVRVEIRTLDAIPVEASGKHRYVVSHVPLAAGLGAAQRVDSMNV
jgi:phenylacetate-CoA ligase